MLPSDLGRTHPLPLPALEHMASAITTSKSVGHPSGLGTSGGTTELVVWHNCLCLTRRLNWLCLTRGTVASTTRRGERTRGGLQDASGPRLTRYLFWLNPAIAGRCRLQSVAQNLGERRKLATPAKETARSSLDKGEEVCVTCVSEARKTAELAAQKA